MKLNCEKREVVCKHNTCMRYTSIHVASLFMFTTWPTSTSWMKSLSGASNGFLASKNVFLLKKNASYASLFNYMLKGASN